MFLCFALTTRVSWDGWKTKFSSRRVLRLHRGVNGTYNKVNNTHLEYLHNFFNYLFHSDVQSSRVSQQTIQLLIFLSLKCLDTTGIINRPKDRRNLEFDMTKKKNVSQCKLIFAAAITENLIEVGLFVVKINLNLDLASG